MHEIPAYLLHVFSWYYTLKSEEKQWRETGGMKKPPVVTLSTELDGSFLTADSTGNILMLLSLKYIHSI